MKSLTQGSLPQPSTTPRALIPDCELDLTHGLIQAVLGSRGTGHMGPLLGQGFCASPPNAVTASPRNEPRRIGFTGNKTSLEPFVKKKVWSFLTFSFWIL